MLCWKLSCSRSPAFSSLSVENALQRYLEGERDLVKCEDSDKEDEEESDERK